MMNSATFHILASIHQQAWAPMRPDIATPVGPSLGHKSVHMVLSRDLCVSSSCRGTTGHRLLFAHCSLRTGVDSNSPRNKNPAVEVDSALKDRQLAEPPPDKAVASTSSRGLVLDLGLVGSWDCAEIGSPVVKRYIGDNEERWYMWYHGSSVSEDGRGRDSIGLATSSNGIHWSRGEGRITRSCGDAGIVMECRDNWWAFDTESIRPSELVVMSSPMYSSVYWLYYTGCSSEAVELSAELVRNPVKSLRGEGRKILRALPGLACSQDGQHWARIEGDHHSGALLDVGSEEEWDSLFIAGPRVVVHSSDDLRMYYHSFDLEKGQYAVGLARSRDGIRWVKCGKITLGGGPSGSFDELGVKSACVARNARDGTYLMAFEAVAADGRTSIGVATSEDGLRNWRSLREGPALAASGADGWDNWGVGSPSLVPMEGHEEGWRMYYVGVGLEGRTGIGMANCHGSDTGSFRRWSGISL